MILRFTTRRCRTDAEARATYFISPASDAGLSKVYFRPRRHARIGRRRAAYALQEYGRMTGQTDAERLLGTATPVKNSLHLSLLDCLSIRFRYFSTF